ncbi:sensor histidine kinase [Pedobacter nototheniae]|uniref:sensor histidine kinase n=1 Tax=Pedobacter nototheniae TaxID=2488994 RepID=UPI00103E26B0|nr:MULTISPECIES: HAMP domain-containing sensor histidine kinase [Pedobacter]
MKIKDRLSLYFTLISTTMLLAVLCTIYFTFLKFLEADFFTRLTDRTMVTAKLYLEADEISRDALNKVRHQYLEKLNGEVIRVYDSKNKATFIGDSAQYWTSVTIDKVRKAGKIQFKDGQKQVVGIYYKDNQGDFVILASAIDQSSHYRLDKLLKIMVVVFLLISLILLISGRWVASRMLLPLQRLMKEVKMANSGNMEFRVREEDNKDEISLLAHSFNQLMEELEQAFILQKTFVANASHELRTPITRVIMTAELALSKEREKEDYKKVLQSILEDSGKMDHIITGLLTLARTDLELATSHLVAVKLNETLFAIQQDWKNNYGFNLIVNTKYDQKDQPIITANPILLNIALNNIISNAFKFSENQPVECTLESNLTEWILSVKDNGIGIAESEKEEIFKPFYSRSDKQKGEGMGLYMASKIVALFKGKIEINSSKSEGSSFIIRFPKL